MIINRYSTYCLVSSLTLFLSVSIYTPIYTNSLQYHNCLYVDKILWTHFAIFLMKAKVTTSLDRGKAESQLCAVVVRRVLQASEVRQLSVPWEYGVAATVVK